MVKVVVFLTNLKYYSKGFHFISMKNILFDMSLLF